jgi:hypothetical protein
MKKLIMQFFICLTCITAFAQEDVPEGKSNPDKYRININRGGYEYNGEKITPKALGYIIKNHGSAVDYENYCAARRTSAGSVIILPGVALLLAGIPVALLNLENDTWLIIGCASFGAGAIMTITGAVMSVKGSRKLNKVVEHYNSTLADGPRKERLRIDLGMTRHGVGVTVHF